MKKWIAAAVVVVLVIAAAIWYKAGSAPAVVETPETAATPIPTATPAPTPAATPTDYEFTGYVESYKQENAITDEDLRNNQDTRYAMYEDIYLSGYDHVDAAKEQEEGCTHEFIEEFRQYSLDRNLEKIPDPNATQDNSGKTEVSPGVYSDGTVREVTAEEVENMTPEERRAYAEANAKQTGAVGSLEEAGGEHVTDEEFKEFMDETWNVDNPYIKDIIDSGVLDN